MSGGPQLKSTAKCVALILEAALQFAHRSHAATRVKARHPFRGGLGRHCGATPAARGRDHPRRLRTALNRRWERTRGQKVARLRCLGEHGIEWDLERYESHRGGSTIRAVIHAALDDYVVARGLPVRYDA